jgi:hypothetical protein
VGPPPWAWDGEPPDWARGKGVWDGHFKHGEKRFKEYRKRTEELEKREREAYKKWRERQRELDEEYEEWIAERDYGYPTYPRWHRRW